jgi:hypothetical protein
MVDLQTISVVIAAASVVIAATYYILIVRNTILTRQAQLFMQLYQGYASEDVNKRQIELLNMEWENYHDFETKYGSDINPDHYARRSAQLQWFNGIGLLVKENLIDLDLVYNTVGHGALMLWTKYESIIREQRDHYRVPEHSKGLEYLANEIKRIRKQKGYPTEPPETLTRYVPDK